MQGTGMFVHADDAVVRRIGLPLTGGLLVTETDAELALPRQKSVLRGIMAQQRQPVGLSQAFDLVRGFVNTGFGHRSQQARRVMLPRYTVDHPRVTKYLHTAGSLHGRGPVI